MIVLKNNDILLFQGDSITHGGRVFSTVDMNHIMGHGYQSILASKIGLDSIDTTPLIINRGISGDSTTNLLKRWKEDTLDLDPSIISILVGINDFGEYLVNKEHNTDVYYNNYRKLLINTIKDKPEVKLILGEPFTFTSQKMREVQKELKDKEEEYISICAEHVKRLADEFDAIFIPYFSELKKYVESSKQHHIVWDGVHPTYVGHEIMARLWYKTVDGKLKINTN